MNIREKIKDNYYNMKSVYHKYPKKECKKCGMFFTKSEKYCSSCGNNIQKEFGIELEKYNKQKDIYNKEYTEKSKEFENDAIEYVGLKGHPKADKAYRFAYEQGHSSGYNEILNWLEEIAELVI